MHLDLQDVHTTNRPRPRRGSTSIGKFPLRRSETVSMNNGEMAALRIAKLCMQCMYAKLCSTKRGYNHITRFILH